MRDRWQENRRASSAKDDVNSTRWRQLVKAMEVTGSKKQVISGNMEGKLVHMEVLLLEEACSRWNIVHFTWEASYWHDPCECDNACMPSFFNVLVMLGLAWLKNTLMVSSANRLFCWCIGTYEKWLEEECRGNCLLVHISQTWCRGDNPWAVHSCLWSCLFSFSNNIYRPIIQK